MKSVITFLCLFFTLLPVVAGEVRIVSLTPALTETICYLGGESALVGRSSACDYPESIKKLPPAGDYAGFYLEQLILLKPDYIVSNDITPSAERQKKQLQAKVMEIPVRSIREYIDSLIILGDLLNRPEAGKRAAAQAEQELEILRKEAEKSNRKPTAIWVIWHKPLLVAGAGALPDTVMKLCGLQNVAASRKEEYFKCSREWFAMQKFDYLIWTVNGVPFRSEGFWKEIPESRVIHNLNHDILLRPGPRIFEGIRHLRDALARKTE